MKKPYEIYVRVFEIKEIKKTVLTWLVSRDGMPSFISSDKGNGPDCGGTVLNNKSLEDAVKEMDSQIGYFLTENEVAYRTETPPWEGSSRYTDTYGLKPLLEKLNKIRDRK